MRLTPQQYMNRVRALDACAEAVEWVGVAGYPDLSTGWRVADDPQWMAWLSVRLLGLAGARGVVAAARTVAKHADTKLAEEPLKLALAHIDGKTRDLEKLAILAFEAAQVGTNPEAYNPNACMAASYALHCVRKLILVEEITDPKLKHKEFLKAVALGSDCMPYCMDADPKEAAKLPDVIRANINEMAMIRVWDKLPL